MELSDYSQYRDNTTTINIASTIEQEDEFVCDCKVVQGILNLLACLSIITVFIVFIVFEFDSVLKKFSTFIG